MLAQILIFFVLGLLSNAGASSVLSACACDYVVHDTNLKAGQRFRTHGVYAEFFAAAKLVVSGRMRGSDIVFAIVAVSRVELQNDLFHIIFTIVLLSLAIQGGLMPTVAIRRTCMIRRRRFEDVTDYQGEKHSIRLNRNLCGHPWIGKALRDVFLQKIFASLLSSAVMSSLFRVANSLEGMIASFSVLFITMTNTAICTHRAHRKQGDRFEDHYIRDIKLRANERIVFIERAGNVIIPTGDVQLKRDDLVVVNQFR